MKNLIIAVAFLSLIIAAPLIAGAPSLNSGLNTITNRKNIMDILDITDIINIANDEPPYSVYHAGPERNCAIPINTKAAGDIGDIIEIEPVSIEDQPHLLIWDKYIVLDTFSGMSIFREEGKPLWKTVKQPRTPPAVVNALLYYENVKTKLNALDSHNMLVHDNIPLPTVMNKEFQLSLLWAREEDFIAVIYRPGRGLDQSPLVSWDRTVFRDRMGEKGGDYEGDETLPPIFIPKLGSLVLAVSEKVIYIDVENGEETSSFQLPLERPIDWSADRDGNLCVIGYENKNKMMVVVSPDGEEDWRRQDNLISDKWADRQPPIRYDERVYALTQSRVLAVDEGWLAWEYKPKGGALRHGSVLADGSLLITAGNTLTRLASDGKALFSLTLDDYNLKLMSFKSADEIPKEGKNLIIIAKIGDLLHFRVFDPLAKIVVDESETKLSDKGAEIAKLKNLIKDCLEDEKEFAENKDELMGIAALITGYPPSDNEILTPPVVDTEENIYVATASRIIKIR